MLPFRLTDSVTMHSDWQPCRALPASCLAWVSYITILRHGPVASHSSEAINTPTPPSIPPLFAPCSPLLILVVIPACLRKHQANLPVDLCCRSHCHALHKGCMSVQVDLSAAVLLHYLYCRLIHYKVLHVPVCKCMESRCQDVTVFVSVSISISFQLY